MKEILSNSIPFLNETCIKQKRVNQKLKTVKSEVQTLLENVIFKEKIKQELNFSYIYWEIINLEKLFHSNLIILEEKAPKIYKCKYEYLVYYKELLLLYKNRVFTLKIKQNLYNLGIYCKYNEIDNDKRLFDLPIFAPKEVFIDIVEAGVTRNIIDRKLNYSMESNIIKEAIAAIKINVVDNTLDSNMKVYYDEVLEFEEDKIWQIDTLRSYLKRKYYEGSIKYEELSFEQKVELINDNSNMETGIKFNYIMPSFIEASEHIRIKDKTSQVNTILTNSSKIKIVFSKYISYLADSNMYLKELLYDILLSKYKLYLDKGGTFDYEDLLNEENQEIPRYNQSDDLVYADIKYDIYNNILIPKYFSDSLIADEKFEEELIYERLGISLIQKYAFLTQYYYVKSKNDSEDNKEYIYKIEFWLNKVDVRFGNKTFTAVIPCFKDFCKIELYDKSKRSIINCKQDQKDITNYIKKISYLENSRDINDYIISCMLKIYPEVKNCCKLEENRWIYDVLYKNEKVNFFYNSNIDTSKFSFDKYIDDEYIKYLLQYFEGNITFLA